MSRARRAALLAAAALSCAAPGASAATETLSCNGDARLCDRRLDQVVLVGSHNAMANRALGFQGPNQRSSIPTQLRNGARVLLVDTYYGAPQPDGKVVTLKDGLVASGTPVFLCHVLCEIGASPLVEVLSQVDRFLDAKRDAVLVIVNEDHVAPADFMAAVQASGLAQHVYRGAVPAKRGGRWPTLRKMVSTDQRVVLFAEGDDGGQPGYHELYRGPVQETPYTWPIPTDLTAPGRLARSCRANRGGTSAPLFLMNHWVGGFPPDSSQADRVNATAVLTRRARACAKARGRLPTMLAVDFFAGPRERAAARSLNGL